MAPYPFATSTIWIGSPVAGTPDAGVAVPYLRKTFHIDKPMRSAELKITALGLYECEINGRPVTDAVFTPGWTDYNKSVQYQSYDVSALLGPGENVLGALLGDGWYCGRVAWKKRQNYGERPALLAQLEIAFQDGSTTVVATDGTWKTTTGPILSSDIMSGETYDARLELGGWSRPAYDDKGWTPVLHLPAAKGRLVAMVGPPVRRIEEVHPQAKPVQRGDKWLFDLGQNFAGRVQLKVTAPAGMDLTIRHAEVLDAKGDLYVANLRSAQATDRYTCRGGGEEKWEPRFTFHGFRYVEVAGAPPASDVDVTGIVLHSEMAPTGSFACSNPLLNQLQHNIVWGQKSNFLDIPTDCPQRDERLGWTGDAHVFIRTAAFNMDVRQFFHKWLRDVRDAQGPNGEVPTTVPAAVLSQWPDVGPAWSDAIIICAWETYLAYDDRSILELHYDAMNLFMKFIAEHRCLDYIRSHPLVDKWGGFGDWLALDGSGRDEGNTPHDLIGTAFYAHDAGIMAQVAILLGRSDDVARYTELRGKIVEAFQRRFVSPEGLLIAATQTACVLALEFDLLTAETRPVALRQLVQDIENRQNHLATGFVGTPYLLDVLESGGQIDAAYRLLEQETFPSWLFPVKNGATTIWERWDGWTAEKGFQSPGMNSFNHYAYGAVGAWMYRTVAGLRFDPAEPGYRHILFRPRPGGTLTWANASLVTSQGEASISWKLDSDEMELDLVVPLSCRATLDLPQGYSAPADVAAGRHHYLLKKSP